MSKYIKIENKIDSYLSHMEQHYHSFIQEGVLGITLNGGLARGFGDVFSEIDLTIYLTDEAFEAYKKGTIRIHSGIIKIQGVIYDVKVVALQHEATRKWSPITELWDLSFAKIVYDTEGKIENFISEKLDKDNLAQTLSGTMFAAWWHFKLACDIWLNRQDVYQGHFVLNEGLKPLLQSLYLVNQQYVPHEKWIVHHLRDLELPEEFDTLIKKLMSQSYELVQLKERQIAFESVWTWINIKGKQIYNLETLNNLTEMTMVEKLTNFIETGIIPDGYSQIDPFFLIIKDENGELLLDSEKISKITLDDMYDWHYAVLDVVRNSQSS